ncbi:MAG: SMC family ATPase [Pyrinomonadaceae bacterium]|nr:SMC family ATPase [Pyrinomonadaceae bacterium]
MHITKIELEDIKSHQAATFEFQRGTTAITGANGAGKTTIIEAVAWTLFDLLDYKKDDFVRRGAKKGVVNVTFESGLDEREYRVYRDTGTGYYVYDLQLKTRIADKKDEVTRFLWQHLGVEAGTDLDALFRRAIGVPQGTFTAIFLETAAERKKAFDKLLKVEEYRQGADKLLETSRYIETQITLAREKIARAEGELARFETVETEHRTFENQARELSENLEKFNAEAAEKSASVKRFGEIETKVNELKAVFEKLQTEKIRAEILLEQKQNELNQAKSAAEKIKLVETDYQNHVSALGKLKELERERIERDKLSQEKSKIETAQVNVRANQKRWTENLEKALNAHREIELLKPKVSEQEALEKQREIWRNDLANANAVETQIKSLAAKMDVLRQKYEANQKQIKDAEAKTKGAGDAENLQRRDLELTNNLAKLRARLESDEKFQSEIKNGLCPILSQKCLNLAAGQTLESFVTTQFSEIKTQISAFESEQRQLAGQLQVSREAGKFEAQLETLRNRQKEIGDEGKSYKDEKTHIETRLENLPQLKTDLSEIEAKLKLLDSPKAKVQLFETEAKREIETREKITEIDKNLERLENDKRIIVEQLESYRDFDANWARYSGQRDDTANAHREFLTNENLAKTAPERTREFEAAKTKLASLKTESEKAAADYNEASADYDRETHIREKGLLAEAETRQTETRANLEYTRKRETQLAEELNRLREIRVLMQSEFQEKERLEKIGEATTFIRDTLKEAAPRVARNYVFHVSMEANQMFREISGNAERTLKWTEDYGISLEENGFERPFINLSGGEQMAAALSVRLALLKQLSDVRLAFFDEPTTNMDAERRERLAEQISHITKRKTFDQLFVISHDDTFEEYVDNVISITGSADDSSAINA